VAVIRVIPAGDLRLVGGTVVIVDGPDAIRQKLAARFKFFLGEWFLDVRQGVPYYRDVFTKIPNLDVIRSLFRKIILDCPGVLSLSSFLVNYDETGRELTFTFAAKVTGGEVVVAPTDRDFILDLAA
jgi:hypothetical protein